MLAVLACVMLQFGFQSQWPPLTEKTAVRALVGEASGVDYKCLLATAEALRNRGHLRGVFGYHAPHIKKEKKASWERAEKAWRESESTNITRGATIWGNQDDVRKFKKTGWFRNVEHTATIGDHSFYKEKTTKRKGRRA